MLLGPSGQEHAEQDAHDLLSDDLIHEQKNYRQKQQKEGKNDEQYVPGQSQGESPHTGNRYKDQQIEHPIRKDAGKSLAKADILILFQVKYLCKIAYKS
jgi:hypothetical protein